MLVYQKIVGTIQQLANFKKSISDFIIVMLKHFHCLKRFFQIIYPAFGVLTLTTQEHTAINKRFFRVIIEPHWNPIPIFPLVKHSNRPVIFASSTRPLIVEAISESDIPSI